VNKAVMQPMPVPGPARSSRRGSSAVHEQQHVFARVAEMLRHGHRGLRRLPAQQGGGIGRRDHHDRPCKTVRPKLVFEKLPYFPPAFAHQGEHRDIAAGAAREHAEQGGFANAGAGEEAEALPPAASGKAIERPHTEV
jgi:hypothetical protein